MEIKKSWEYVIGQEKLNPYFGDLCRELKYEYDRYEVYPKYEDLFNAFSFFDVQDTKVVILGQDPYINPDQAHGLAFSVRPECSKIPPSLKNVFKEISEDLNTGFPENGCLNRWAEQGVLLLNTIMTVRRGKSLSHKNIGWEDFTNVIIRKTSLITKNVVFILWGAKAQKKLQLIDNNNNKHLVLTAPHPSPFSADTGFFGCKHFSKCNTFLEKHNKTPIEW